jgi:hypothetical protein
VARADTDGTSVVCYDAGTTALDGLERSMPDDTPRVLLLDSAPARFLADELDPLLGAGLRITMNLWRFGHAVQLPTRYREPLDLVDIDGFDEDALAQALSDPWAPLAFAAVDVFAHEHADFASPLIGLHNALLTPHIAGMTDGASRRAANQLSHSILKLLDGRSAGVPLAN